MKLLSALAVACLVAAPAFAAEDPTACPRDARTQGLLQRVDNIRGQMERIEWSADRAEQRRLLDLHAKTMQEGMREMRRRDPAPACREQIVQAMIEQVMRHQLAVQEHE